MRDIDRCFPMVQGRRRARPIHLAAAATLFICFSPSPSRHSAGPVRVAAASSPPYNAYQYDMTIPQFTPDGRLLQVEYASRAPEQSGPLVAVPVWSNDGDEENGDGPSVVIASIAARSPLSEDDSKEEDDATDYEKNGAQVPTSKRRRKGQRRLITLPLGPTLFSAPGAPSSPARSIVVGLSGILADATSLLGTVQDDLTQYRRMYGLGKLHAVLPAHSAEGNSGSASATSATQTASTVVARRVARGVGRYCQRNSFGGGIRPFGASLVICGVDESGVCICVTEPSGAVLANQFSLDALRKKASDALKGGDEESNDIDETESGDNARDNVTIVGGDGRVQRKLREQLANKLSFDGSLRSTVDAVVASLLDAQGYTGIDNEPSLITPKHALGTNDGIIDLEIVIARSDGSYKLTSKEVDAIIVRVTSRGDDNA